MAIEAAGIGPTLAARRAGASIHTVTVALLIATAVIGFAPRSAAILSGAMPVPPLAVHVHAALMTTWLALLGAQTALVAAGRQRVHRSLGAASTVVAPLLVATLVWVTIVRYRDLSAAGLGAFATNILFLQIRSILFFPLFIALALRARLRDPETHKRMMILATLSVIDAAIARHTWLPGNDIRVGYDATHAYLFLLLVPALAYELVRFGRVHRAYLVGLALLVPWAIATHFVWNAPWWHAFAADVLGTG